jgi:hypothetical protein
MDAAQFLDALRRAAHLAYGEEKRIEKLRYMHLDPVERPLVREPE